MMDLICIDLVITFFATSAALVKRLERETVRR